MNEMLEQFMTAVSVNAPRVLAALAILVVGWILAILLSRGLRKLLQKTGLTDRLPGWLDTGFSSDSGVDGTHQRCRDVNDWNTSEIGACNEAGHVGESASADADDEVFTGETALVQESISLLNNGEALRLLAVGQRVARDCHASARKNICIGSRKTCG